MVLIAEGCGGESSVYWPRFVFRVKIGYFAKNIGIMQYTALTAKQACFVSEYLVDGNGAQTVIRSGVAASGAQVWAFRTISIAKVSTALQARQSADAAVLSIQRDDVLAVLQESVQLAREQRNPMGVIASLRELAKMLDFHAPEAKRVELNAGQVAVKGNVAAISDEQLLALIAQGAVAV
jgi:phage terminase small subunit